MYMYTHIHPFPNMSVIPNNMYMHTHFIPYHPCHKFGTRNVISQYHYHAGISTVHYVFLSNLLYHCCFRQIVEIIFRPRRSSIIGGRAGKETKYNHVPCMIDCIHVYRSLLHWWGWRLSGSFSKLLVCPSLRILWSVVLTKLATSHQYPN